ncbi:MAG: hypothetical protein ACRCZF_13335, partial [Gemmataceae bacterium]
MKRRILAVVAVAAGLLMCVSLYASRAGVRGNAPAKRIALDTDIADLWPVSRSWVWNVDPVATKKRVGVCVRSIESKIPVGSSPSVPVTPELLPKGVERHSGWRLVGDQQFAGRVTCQVIDFREAGLTEAA